MPHSCHVGRSSLMAFSQSARSASLPVCLFPYATDCSSASSSTSPSLLIPLPLSLSVLSCSSYFICNFWKYFAYATFAGMGRRDVDYNNIRHKSDSQLTPQSFTPPPFPPCPIPHRSHRFEVPHARVGQFFTPFRFVLLFSLLPHTRASYKWHL